MQRICVRVDLKGFFRNHLTLSLAVVFVLGAIVGAAWQYTGEWRFVDSWGSAAGWASVVSSLLASILAFYLAGESRRTAEHHLLIERDRAATEARVLLPNALSQISAKYRLILKWQYDRLQASFHPEELTSSPLGKVNVNHHHHLVIASCAANAKENTRENLEKIVAEFQVQRALALSGLQTGKGNKAEREDVVFSDTLKTLRAIARVEAAYKYARREERQIEFRLNRDRLMNAAALFPAEDHKLVPGYQDQLVELFHKTHWGKKYPIEE